MDASGNPTGTAPRPLEVKFVYEGLGLGELDTVVFGQSAIALPTAGGRREDPAKINCGVKLRVPFGEMLEHAAQSTPIMNL